MSSIITNTLANCPDNPFTCLRTVFRSQIDPAVTEQYLIQIYVLSGLLALSLIIQLLILVIRWKKNNFKLYSISNGYIVPNYTICWTICSCFLLASVQGFIWSRVNSETGKNPTDLAQWVLTPWISALLGFYFAAWALFTSRLVHRNSFSTPSTSFFLKSKFINTILIVLPILLSINLAVLVSLANNQYRTGLQLYLQVDNVFAIAEGQFNNHPFNPLPLIESQASLLIEVASKLANFLTYFQDVFISYLVWGVLTELFLLIAGILQIRTLKRGLEIMKEGADSYGTGTLTNAELSLGKQYRSLVIVTIVLAIVTTLFNANFAFIVGATQQVLSNPDYFEVSTLLPLYIFALSTPLAIYMLYRTIRDPTTPSQTTETNHFDKNRSRSGSMMDKSLVGASDNHSSTTHEAGFWTSTPSPTNSTYQISRQNSTRSNVGREGVNHNDQFTVIELNNLNSRISNSGNGNSSYGNHYKNEESEIGHESKTVESRISRNDSGRSSRNW